MWSERRGKSEEAKDNGGSEIFQMLGGQPSQMGMPKYWGWKEEEKRERGSICDQTTKGIARKKTGISHIEKGTEILWVSQIATYWFVSWWFDDQKAQKSKV